MIKYTTRKRIMQAAGAAALAGAILGGALLGQPAAKAETVEACVVRAQEYAAEHALTAAHGYCVIAGRPANDRQVKLSALDEDFSEILVEAETSEQVKILYTKVTPVAGILPEIPETSADDAVPVGDAETSTMNSDPSGTARYLGTYKITGYDICIACCGKTDGITASGTQATVGRTCAAPPDIPFGTRIWIAGIGERVVEDRGGLGSSKIDVLCADHAACYAITTEGKVDVWILEE